MHRLLVVLLSTMLVLALAPPLTALAADPIDLAACADCALSTEEDFYSQGPTPPDGNAIISDGDLLGCNGAVCMRNSDLVQQFDVTVPMGLDAVDILDVENVLVAFSTELDSPHGNFTTGDLLFSTGAAIPNQALTTLFQLGSDCGLDAIHFVGTADKIIDFADLCRTVSRDEWLRQPGKLIDELESREMDIWFSLEGTEMDASTIDILDGDLLSVRNGAIVARNDELHSSSVPAGIPSRGVDMGLDAATCSRDGTRTALLHSPEILYRGQSAFVDGDVLKYGGGVYASASSLTAPFEPKADMLGTDAFYRRIADQGDTMDGFLAIVMRYFDILSVTSQTAQGGPTTPAAPERPTISAETRRDSVR